MHLTMLTLRLHAYWKVKRRLDRHLDADSASSKYAQLLKERMVPYVPGRCGTIELYLQSLQGRQRHRISHVSQSLLSHMFHPFL